MAQTVKNLPAVQETWVQSLVREDPLEKGMATHSSVLAWRIPWTEEPGGLQSMGSQSRTQLSDSHTIFNKQGVSTSNKNDHHLKNQHLGFKGWTASIFPYNRLKSIAKEETKIKRKDNFQSLKGWNLFMNLSTQLQSTESMIQHWSTVENQSSMFFPQWFLVKCREELPEREQLWDSGAGCW